MSKKILIVDDDHSIRESLSKLLSTEGYEIGLAEDGEQGIKQLAQGHVDLLLLDLGLPEKDGWTIMRWLSQVNPLFPVIIITGQFNQRELAMKSRADALIEKPLDVPCLVETIRELINEPIECRVQRSVHRPFAFRYVPWDTEQFREFQAKRFTTPYMGPDLINH